jgi:hypothetical protein
VLQLESITLVNTVKEISSSEIMFFFMIPYILKSNPHSVFGDFLNEKKLVRGSNPHLSFNRPLPTGRLIE